MKLLIMSPKTTKIALAGIILLILVSSIYIFTQQPFRDDTEAYLVAKRESWLQVQSANSNEKTKAALESTQQKLSSIKCHKVNQTYQKECDSLKYKVDQIVQITQLPNTTDEQNKNAKSLATELAQILKN